MGMNPPEELQPLGPAMGEGDDYFSWAIAQGGGLEQESKFIGIPDDYVAPFAIRDIAAFPGIVPSPGRVGLPPEPGYVQRISPYQRKDAFEIMAWDPAEVQQLQRIFQLLGPPFGFSKGQQFVAGVADPPTVSKWKALLGFANQKGKTWQEAVQLITEGTPVGGEEAQRAPFVSRLTHPDDLRRVYQAAARQLIGREVETSEISEFISSYQTQERSGQRRAYDLAETGGEIVAPSDPGTAAQGDIERRFPAEVYGQDLRGAMEGLMAAIQGRISAEGFGA